MYVCVYLHNSFLNESPRASKSFLKSHLINIVGLEGGSKRKNWGFYIDIYVTREKMKFYKIFIDKIQNFIYGHSNLNFISNETLFFLFLFNHLNT